MVSSICLDSDWILNDLVCLISLFLLPPASDLQWMGGRNGKVSRVVTLVHVVR